VREAGVQGFDLHITENAFDCRCQTVTQEERERERELETATMMMMLFDEKVSFSEELK